MYTPIGFYMKFVTIYKMCILLWSLRVLISKHFVWMKLANVWLTWPDFLGSSSITARPVSRKFVRHEDGRELMSTGVIRCAAVQCWSSWVGAVRGVHHFNVTCNNFRPIIPVLILICSILYLIKKKKGMLRKKEKWFHVCKCETCLTEMLFSLYLARLPFEYTFLFLFFLLIFFILIGITVKGTSNKF